VSWDHATLYARIADESARLRHRAASPDPPEIAAYRSALPLPLSGPLAILGMTPELRAMARDVAPRVIAVDRSPEALEVYGPWLPADGHEEIVHGDWYHLPELLGTPAAAVLGDGVFGNLPDEHAHLALLRRIAAALAPTGVLVTRHALIPRTFTPSADDAGALLDRHRRGLLDADEFGFGIRLLGHHGCCYEPATGRLRNAKLFAEMDAAHARGELAPTEHAAIVRYRFGGDNCILGQDRWEAILTEAGFRFRLVTVAGTADWYRYYPIYACQPPDGG
jgi:hypothetical protein